MTRFIACILFLLCYSSQTSAQIRVWVEDGVPAGAVLAGDGEGWSWTGSSPAPFSGSLAHQSNVVAGAHQHYFYGATDTLTVAAGESLFAYVYLDPANPPREVMLQWNSNQEGWNHRAYWGANLIPWGTDGTINRRYMGTLPAGGGWARLEVPASMVGLEGKTLNGMAFTLYDGRATWDKAGKTPPMGDWAGYTTLPVVPIHLHLLPNRKVLFWSRDKDAAGNDVAYSTQAYVWDPATKVATKVANSRSNLFCAGHSLLPDGRLLVTGGHEYEDLKGLSHANIFDPADNTWTAAQDMNAGRWYPTNTTLGSGEVLVTSGTYKLADGSVHNNSLPQVWSPVTGAWRDLSQARKDLPLYPWTFQAPNGQVFYAGPGQTTEYLNTSVGGAWSVVGNRVQPIHRGAGSAVMYGNGKVLVVGGTPDEATTPPTNTAEVIDLNGGSPTWYSAASMVNGRFHNNATVLPDGKVLVTGGENGGGPVKVAELWDPEAGLAITGTNLKRGRWSTMASEKQPRLYHSTAILLPDGRVMSAGGGFPGANNYNDAEFFSPPYLFRGPRPQITNAPPSVQYNQTFFVSTPDTNISRATLVRLGSVTHSFDQNQRFNELAIVSRVAGGLNLRAPADGNVCPPGHYMLFLLNDQGVPSVASIVQVTKSTLVSVATGADNLTRVLWKLPNGAAQIWTLSADGTTRFNSVTHGPFKGWSPRAVSVGPDNVPHLLWSNLSGNIDLWRLNQDNSRNASRVYGPFAGWKAVGLAGSTDGRPRVLWERISDGRTDLWRVNPDFSYTYVAHGPFAGWRPVSVGVGYDNRPRILWRYDNGPNDPATGRVSIWNCNPDGSRADFREHGPFAGWGPTAVAAGGDNLAHLLWNHYDGRIGVWSVDGAGNRLGNSDYGPSVGWAALSMSNGGDSQSRIGWQHANGRFSIWTLNPENVHLSTTEYAAP
ncbi:MAG: DUF1929 domain-containing protein [Acidobacteriota bacterium]|nr:DUF1929 domain-containing protein [Acidobacteriota bacterium]